LEGRFVISKIQTVSGGFGSNKLILESRATLDKIHIDENNVDIFYAPGAFEIPLLAKKLAKSGKYHGIVTLGAVINGETPHYKA
jgi:6,7-dimethyl-8-ribityllumazine synthase